MTGVAKASDCDKVHQPMGPGEISCAHTTVGVAIGGPAST